MVRKIATAGRDGTSECVTEYIVQYSDDGEMWKSFTDSDGEEQVNPERMLLSPIYVFSVSKCTQYSMD